MAPLTSPTPSARRLLGRVGARVFVGGQQGRAPLIPLVERETPTGRRAMRTAPPPADRDPAQLRGRGSAVCGDAPALTGRGGLRPPARVRRGQAHHARCRDRQLALVTGKYRRDHWAREAWGTRGREL